MGATKELFIQMQDELVNTCDAVENGDINVLDAVIELRKQKQFHEEMLKEIKNFETQYSDEIEQEATANQNEYRGATFEFRAGRKTFDFSKIKEVKIAKDNVKELEQKYKQAFEMKQKGMTAIDESTGEIITELPTVKYAKSSIIVKLPKE